MSASPHSPAQPMAEVTSGTLEQRGKQVLDLVAGQADQPRLMAGAGHGGVAARTTRKAWASMARVVQRYQERQRRT
jgi:hypothetical protein